MAATLPGTPYTQPWSLASKGRAPAARLELRSVPLDSFLLLSRGFHWIQEDPYNR